MDTWEVNMRSKSWMALMAISKGSLVLTFASVLILLASVAAGQSYDPVGVARASAAVAESLPLDVTRLALTVAVASVVTNGACFVIFLALIRRGLARPCLMSSQSGEAVMRDAFRRAREDSR